MKVKRIMSKQIEQTVADATLLDVAGLMRNLDVGMLPVFDGSELVGVITDRDIVVRGVATGLDPTLARARDIMTRQIYACFEEDDEADAARIMEQHQVRRLLVYNPDGYPVGICSLADIVHRNRSNRPTGHPVQEVVQPSGSSSR